MNAKSITTLGSRSCSPPSLSSTGTPDAEITDAKNAFFSQMRENFKGLGISEDELERKIWQIWNGKQPEKKVTKPPVKRIAKRVPKIKLANRENGKKFKDVASVLKSNFNGTVKPLAQNDKNVENVASSLGIDTSKDVDQNSESATYSDCLKRKMIQCTIENSFGSKRKNEILSNENRTMVKINKEDIEIPVEEGEDGDDLFLEPGPSKMQVQSTVKKAVVKITPPVVKTFTPRQNPVASKQMQAKHLEPVNEPIESESKSIEKPVSKPVLLMKPVSKLMKTLRQTRSGQTLKVKKVQITLSKEEIIHEYYLGLCQPLLQGQHETQMTKYNQEKLAMMVEGWKRVREYKGLL